MVLIILDGWGERKDKEHNAIKLAQTPTFDALFAHYPHTLLNASGEAVGLPKGQMGNSEVGHLHIGSGRKVPQDLTRIDQAIESGDFFKNPVLLAAIQQAKKTDHAVHILGLLSPGGVHSRDNQIAAMIELVNQQGVKKNYLHAILDGRDTPPKSAQASLQMINDHYARYGSGKIASIIGRYYAMDRDKRWERTQKAYDLLTQGIATYHATSADEALQNAYRHNETDEFVKPTSIHAEGEKPITIADGDVVIFMNFRADRARQLTLAFTETTFNGFQRQVVPKLAAFVTLTAYAKAIQANVAFPPLKLANTLGEYLAKLGMRQLRIAETEKYAHVTYFLNGGVETPNPNEDRILIPSPKVATYDLKPEMSAIEVTDKLVDAINQGKYDLIICNFANPDMVGHTGDEEATKKAISTIDTCMQRIIDAIKTVGGEALITSDHGNAELMFDKKTGQPHTAHTNNLVPFIYVGREAKFRDQPGALDDVAPTLLYLLGLQPPAEMTGTNLITLK
jgi:2,3-bisphosphoglycerate-independent phosphoglycerate mutase